jgi:hypothetical protein
MHAAEERKGAGLTALENFGQKSVKEAKVLNFEKALSR